jgi:hypothetical protein
MKTPVAALGLATAFMLVACPPASSVTTFKATLNGASQVPPVTTSATGTVTASLNGSILTLTGTYSGLSGVPLQAHIHGPTSASVQNAPVLCNLYTTDGVPGVGSGSISSSGASTTPCSAFALTADQITALNAGNLYVNLHTDANKNGEIRGALIKQ